MNMADRHTLSRTLATRIGPVSRGWRRLADRILASLEISNSAGWALIHLERMGADPRQADLARQIGIAEPSLVRTLKQLERSGLVVRETDQHDRRANRLRLTEQGEGRAGQIDVRLTELRTQLLEGLSDAELAAAVKVITTIEARVLDRLGGA